MLDQNTDRMWFVIGAVIVGAAIIFIANGTLPTLFASVSDSFEGASDNVTESIAEMDVYGVKPFRKRFEGYTFNFPEDSGTWLFPTKSAIEAEYDHIALAFPRRVDEGSNIRVEIEKPFSKPNTQYEISFNAHRAGWSDISYSLYLGDTRVGTFEAGQTEQSYSYSVTSPTELNRGANMLSIRSNHTGGSNAFWMSQLNIVEK